jgi:hypothetical protein
MQQNDIPKNVVNPFSDKFEDTWGLWKNYRWEEHKFKYKGVISEQMALKRLVTVSEGDEEKAVRIVEQSIGRGWMDFYELKQPNPNGTRKKTNSKSAGDQNGDLRSRVQAAVNTKFGGGGQESGDSHLKAV